MAILNRNELDRIAVEGNAQTVYYVREEDKKPYWNKTLPRPVVMLIMLVESQMERIIYQSSPTEVMYPEAELPFRNGCAQRFSLAA